MSRLNYAGDFAGWSDHCERELDKFREREGWSANVWLDSAAARKYVAGVQARSPHARAGNEFAAFVGPWHMVRRHVTREFRQYVEESREADRCTLSEWRERAAVMRRELAETEAEEASPDGALYQLEALTKLLAERDALICEAALKGASKTAIARAVNLSRQHVYNVLAAEQLRLDAVTGEFADTFDNADEWDSAEAF